MKTAEEGLIKMFKPIEENAKTEIEKHLEMLFDIKGGLEGGKAWDEELPPKASWAKLQAVVKATLRKSSCVADMDMTISAAKKAYTRYTTICEALGQRGDPVQDQMGDSVQRGRCHLHNRPVHVHDGDDLGQEAKTRAAQPGTRVA